jgi:hypothetical protein
MYRWPVIDEVAIASRGTVEPLCLRGATPVLRGPLGRAAEIILKRRSAQRYDRDQLMPRSHFARILDSVAHLQRGSELHILAFVHNVEGLDRGLYALPATSATEPQLRAALDTDFQWRTVAVMPEVASLRLLAGGDFRKLARALTCHQAIAADACVTICMLAEFAGLVGAAPWRYRHLHWQAGLLGQRFYLEAEALGLNGTGIGCFLDDEVHRLLGIADDRFQAVYFFALGRALSDERVSAAPAYPGRSRREVDLQGQ